MQAEFYRIVQREVDVNIVDRYRVHSYPRRSDEVDDFVDTMLNEVTIFLLDSSTLSSYINPDVVSGNGSVF